MSAPGAGMGAVISLALQEALVVGLHTLASDVRAIEEMIGRSDELRHNSTEEWRRSLVAAMLEMLDPRNGGYADVLIGYPVPFGTSRLPALSIVEQSGGENPSELLVGNLIGRTCEFHGPNQEAWRTTYTGGGHTTSVQIGAWTISPERSMLLRAAAIWSLYEMQDMLESRGVHELSIRTGGAEVSPDLEPRVAYVPMVDATLMWTLRQSSRMKVPNRVTIRPGTFST